MVSQFTPHDFRQQYLQGFNAALTLSGIADPRMEPNQISNVTIECTSKKQKVPPALRRQQVNEPNGRLFDQHQNNSNEQINKKFKQPNSLMLILRVESWYPTPPLWFFKAVFGSIGHHQRLLSTIYLKGETKIKPRSKNKNQEQTKSRNQSSRNIHHKVTMHPKCLPVQRFGEKVSMLQIRPHMNDSKLTVRYIPPSSTKDPTAESPSTSLRSAFAQMRSYGSACACAYVAIVSNRCAGPAGSSSESQKAAFGWARVRAISSAAATSVNVLNTHGGCSIYLDLVTAGVTRYRCCCSGPGEDDRPTRWSCCPLVNVAATVSAPDPPPGIAPSPVGFSAASIHRSFAKVTAAAPSVTTDGSSSCCGDCRCCCVSSAVSLTPAPIECDGDRCCCCDRTR